MQNQPWLMALILPHFELLSLRSAFSGISLGSANGCHGYNGNHGYHCLMQNVPFVNSKYCAILWTCYPSILAFWGISSGSTNGCHGSHCYYGYHCSIKMYLLPMRIVVPNLVPVTCTVYVQSSFEFVIQCIFLPFWRSWNYTFLGLSQYKWWKSMSIKKRQMLKPKIAITSLL